MWTAASTATATSMSRWRRGQRSDWSSWRRGQRSDGSSWTRWQARDWFCNCVGQTTKFRSQRMTDAARKVENENNWKLMKKLFHTNLWPCPLDSGLIKCAELMILLPASETESPADAINYGNEKVSLMLRTWKREKFNFSLDSPFHFPTPNSHFLW